MLIAKSRDARGWALGGRGEQDLLGGERRFWCSYLINYHAQTSSCGAHAQSPQGQKATVGCAFQNEVTTPRATKYTASLMRHLQRTDDFVTS